MDFCQLLHTAQKNEKTNKNGVQYYSTKFEPPKKEKKAKELSRNIQKFLAKKEAEEKLKEKQEKKRKEELLALRAQDKKATRRVNVMLKRTKSANQSVIEDAVDNDNTAVTLAGPMQPDEDDYGYVSQEASAFYNKMMEKYSKMPDEPKFDLTKKKVSTNLSSTKDRVRAALEKEREEAMLPRRRKRKHKEQNDEGDEEGISYGRPEGPNEQKVPLSPSPPPPPSKKHKPAPPPMNFADLLKIAEKKQFEPIIIEKKEKEAEKLLTKKQRKEMEREKEYIQKKEARRHSESKGLPQPTISNNNRLPKVGEKSLKAYNSEKNEKNYRSNENKPQSSEVRSQKINSHSPTKPITSNFNDSIKKPSTSSVSNKFLSTSDKSWITSSVPLKSSKPSICSGSKATIRDQENYRHSNNLGDNFKDRQKVVVNDKVKDISAKGLPSKKTPPEEVVPTRKYLPGDIRYKPPVDIKPKQLPPTDLRPKSKQLISKDVKPKQLPHNDLKQKQFLPSDVKLKQNAPVDIKPKQFPPKDLKPKQFPPPDVRRKDLPPKKKPVMAKKGRILDDSDHDSEMDDFIDDDDTEEDYSKYISEIFGYDKSRYRDVDDDVDNMESSFAQQMKEEVISTKIGIMEDLEDMKKEEEEKRRKALLKKRK